MELGSFVVEKEIGRGGSGVVYAVTRGKERLALKVQRDDETSSTVERFLEEAEKLERIAHPAIVRVVDAGTLPDGRAFLAMPLLEGETLAERALRGPIEVSEALRIFGALASGVRALHEAGLVHRDIKAENVVLVGDPPAPVLLDLGIAKDVASEASTTTQQGIVRGTPATMAPERFFGQPASVASDVYELAVLLHVMLLGALPWQDGSDADARLSVKAPRDADDRIPQHLSDAILDALATRPSRRPVSVKAFCDRVLQTPPVSTIRSTAALDAPQNETPQGTVARAPSLAPPSRLRAVLIPAIVGIASAAAALAIAPRLSSTSDAGAPEEPSAASTPAKASSGAEPTRQSELTASARVDSPSPEPAADATAAAVGGSLPTKPRAEGAESADPAPVEPAAAPAEVVTSASALPPVAAKGVFVEFPTCHAYATEKCDADGGEHRGFCRSTVRMWIDQKKGADRAKIGSDCTRLLGDLRKQKADEAKADALVESKLPACKAWLDRSCSAEVRGREATRGFCSATRFSVRNLALVKLAEANGICQTRLDDWQNAVDRAVAEFISKEAERKNPPPPPGSQHWGFGQF